MTEHGAAELVAPEPGDIVESLRDFGYTLPTALADLIDNSLTASAGSIDVTISASPEPTDSSIVVLDDGVSMEASTLVEAMRLGTRGPLARRGDADLGRFGLGLKTAALSQGRCLTVITKTVGGTHPIVRRWDLDHIQKTRLWQLLDVPTALGEDVVSLINEKRSGTAVVIEKLDRPSFLRVPASTREEHLGSALNRIRRHLAMVFHRFIERGVSIRLGTTELAPWDPFCRKHSRQLPAETLFLGEGRIVVTPYVLPHHSKLTDEEHADAAGPRGWNAHQGFYIYRCERLIVPGTWLNLGLRNEEHFKLARIQVDLPNDLDTEWQLNVMKSHVAAPASLRDDVKRIAAHVRREAAAVYRHRGERAAPSTHVPQRFVWRRQTTKKSVRYRIDRTHPAMQALLHSGCAHESLLNSVLSLVEETVPVASILQEPAKALDGAPVRTLLDSVDSWMELVIHSEQYLIRAGISPAEARKRVLETEPFASYRDELLQKLEESARP